MSAPVISQARLAALNAGHAQTTHLAECLAVDFASVLQAIAGDLAPAAVARMHAAASLGITRRMQLAAAILHDAGDGDAARWRAHPSDTVRGWACYLIAAERGCTLPERIDAMRPLADDPHFGVREWAWLALRDAIVAEPMLALGTLQPWTADASPYLRRFASEATRPRGVWAAHIGLLKQEPEHAEPLLDALAMDPHRYVQDSVGNWLNDAAKTRPDWVHAVCARWALAHPGDASGHIRKRALRSL